MTEFYSQKKKKKKKKKKSCIIIFVGIVMLKFNVSFRHTREAIWVQTYDES